jgi:hypothetical protein
MEKTAAILAKRFMLVTTTVRLNPREERLGGGLSGSALPQVYWAYSARRNGTGHRLTKARRYQSGSQVNPKRSGRIHCCRTLGSAAAAVPSQGPRWRRYGQMDGFRVAGQLDGAAHFKAEANNTAGTRGGYDNWHAPAVRDAIFAGRRRLRYLELSEVVGLRDVFVDQHSEGWMFWSALHQVGRRLECAPLLKASGLRQPPVFHQPGAPQGRA